MKKFISILVLVLLLSTQAFSANQMFNWDKTDGADGYKIFQRTENGTYDYNSPAWQGSTLTAIIDIIPGVDHYFVIRGYNVCGNESGDSPEVMKNIPICPVMFIPVWK